MDIQAFPGRTMLSRGSTPAMGAHGFACLDELCAVEWVEINFEAVEAVNHEQAASTSIEGAWTPKELERRAEVKAGRAVVVNVSKGKDEALRQWAEAAGRFVYIGRRGRHGRPQSDWHNPFRVGKDGTRAKVCERFAAYLAMKPDLQVRLSELQGKVLGCWCWPEECHGETLARLANTALEPAVEHHQQKEGSP